MTILDEKFLQIQNVIALHCFLNSGTSVLLWVSFFDRQFLLSYCLEEVYFIFSVFKKGGKECSYLENNILYNILSSLMSGIQKNLEEFMNIVHFHGQS